jgi:DNA ligase (NAD+)
MSRITTLLENAVSNGELEAVKALLTLCDSIYYTGKSHTYKGQKYSIDDLPKDEFYDQLRKEYTSDFKPTDYFVLDAEKGSKEGLVEHPFPMGSLTKYKGDAIDLELPQIYNRIPGPKFASAKVDGVSLRVWMEKGNLVMALTRHDHKFGRTVTGKASLFVPRPDPSFSGKIVIRGEVIMRGEAYKAIGYENRRNGAAGILGRKDNSNVKSLHYVAYEITDYSNPEDNVKKDEEKTEEATDKKEKATDKKEWPTVAPTTMTGQFELLQRLGYETPPSTALETSDIKKAFFETLYTQWKASLDYDIDGVVVGPGAVVKELSDPPKLTVAVKFDAPGAWTKVTAILPRATRTGNVIPQVYIEPVEVSGSTISTIAGANYMKLAEKNIKKGSHVYVTKANEVIPFIEKVDNESVETVETLVPTECPSCGTALTIEEGQRILKCPNITCPAKVSGTVTKFVRGIGVSGFSETRLGTLGAESLFDLYNMSVQDMVRPGIGRATAESLWHQLRSCLHPIAGSKLLAAMGMHLIGEVVARTIVSAIKLEKLFGDKPPALDELTVIKGIGSEKAKQLLNFHSQGVSIMKLLYNNGLEIAEEEAPPSSTASSSSSSDTEVVCLTGGGNMTRAEYEKKIIAKGWRAVNAVSSKVTLLVADDLSSTTKKMQDAKARGIKIVDYAAFEKMLS